MHVNVGLINQVAKLIDLSNRTLWAFFFKTFADSASYVTQDSTNQTTGYETGCICTTTDRVTHPLDTLESRTESSENNTSCWRHNSQWKKFKKINSSEEVFANEFYWASTLHSNKAIVISQINVFCVAKKRLSEITK